MLYKNMILHNVAEMLEEEGGISITRIPENLRVNLNKQAMGAAKASAGCEMRFNLKSKEAKIVLTSNVQSVAEVYQGNFFKSMHFINDKPSVIPVSIPANIDVLRSLSKKMHLSFDAGLTRVVLPYHVTKIIDIEGDFEPPLASQLPKANYLAYGSSITHGAAAVSPSGTYIMNTAARLEVNLFNLGFGGGAHYENQMADYIAGRKDWDFASFEMGINMVGGFEVDEFRKRVEYFLGTVVKKHPRKYIFCIDMFTFNRDIADVGNDKHEQFRKVVRNAVKKTGSEKVIHLDGRKLLKNVSGLTFDLVHPSPAGMEEIALNLSREIGKRIKKYQR
ncbi:MAG TPA: SGNH/GDSL hydrolase family protein [bacterium]|nr:SGNH/GDSL hydrolase family protein [bacterium]